MAWMRRGAIVLVLVGPLLNGCSTVTKGGLVFGGGYGQGVVYAQGQHIGYASLAQASFGLQVGGHTYRELIVLENKAALDRFRENRTWRRR
jgi:lipid-binding SYLF domain-containing protein